MVRVGILGPPSGCNRAGATLKTRFDSTYFLFVDIARLDLPSLASFLQHVSEHKILAASPIHIFIFRSSTNTAHTHRQRAQWRTPPPARLGLAPGDISSSYMRRVGDIREPPSPRCAGRRKRRGVRLEHTLARTTSHCTHARTYHITQTCELIKGSAPLDAAAPLLLLYRHPPTRLGHGSPALTPTGPQRVSSRVSYWLLLLGTAGVASAGKITSPNYIFTLPTLRTPYKPSRLPHVGSYAPCQARPA